MNYWYGYERMKKRFVLLECYPVGFGSANNCLLEVEAINEQEAIALIQPRLSVKLDSNGYAKVGSVTYTIGELFDPYQSNNKR